MLKVRSIAFVHGLTGNRETTWTDNESGIFWPRDLLPNDMPTARIITFEYDADIIRTIDIASANSLRDHGKSLANDLAMLRMRTKTTDRPLLLVAHSLGGLVCEQVNSPARVQLRY